MSYQFVVPVEKCNVPTLNTQLIFIPSQCLLPAVWRNEMFWTDSQLHFVTLHKTDSTFPFRLVHQSTDSTYEWLICYFMLWCKSQMSLVHYSQSTIQFITVCPSCSVRWADHRYRSAFQTVPLTLWENSIEILHYMKCNSSNCNNRLTKISFFANTPESSSTSTSREKILFSYNPSYVVVMGLNLIGYDNILLTSSLLRSEDMMA